MLIGINMPTDWWPTAGPRLVMLTRLPAGGGLMISGPALGAPVLVDAYGEITDQFLW